MWIHPYVGAIVWIHNFLALHINDGFSKKNVDTSLYRDDNVDTNVANEGYACI